MMTMYRGLKTIALSLALTSFGVGCAGSSDLGYSEAAALNTAAVDVAPLDLVELEVWQTALAGCEGQLQDASRYGIAAGEPELLVAIDVADQVICVDSYASVESELLDEKM